MFVHIFCKCTDADQELQYHSKTQGAVFHVGKQQYSNVTEFGVKL